MIVCKVQSGPSFVNDTIHLVSGAAARLPEADAGRLMKELHG